MTTCRSSRHRLPLVLLLALALPAAASAQDRLKTYPGYDQFMRMQPQIMSAVKSGALNVSWVQEGKGLEYTYDGKRWRYDLARKEAVEVPMPPQQGMRGMGMRPERGRQFAEAWAPDSSHKAFYRDRNLWLSDKAGANEVAVTTAGSEKDRTKFGSASWVYGEELDQNTAIWWSPNGKQVAYYGFDEKPVPDYYLQLDQTKLQSRMDIEAYPKAGVDNPIVDMYVYDVASGKHTPLDIRMGQPFRNDVVGYYAYHVDWTPDGREITLNRTNRRQNVMEFTACSPETGKCRVIVHEEWLPSWTENAPAMQYLKDGKRFIWTSERTGFRNLYLYDLSGKLVATLTNHPFDVERVVRVDEKAGVVWYMARSGDNYMKQQLHRVSLNGKGDRRITDPAFNHTASVSPDGKFIVDVAQTHDQAPVTRLLDHNGKLIAELARSDISKFQQLGLKPVELFTYTAADGQTQLHAMLQRPSNFDPAKKYPVLVSVYGGPATNGASENFVLPSPLTELGFLLLTLDARSAGGRGKQFLDAIYQKLGVTEIDDMAAAVKALRARPYVDPFHIGIFGTSYGGYSSVMALLRYPDVFQAAAAMSPVTAWKHYDTIYTERYMWIPQENGAGYENGSATRYVNDLKGRLMLYYGTADNNVHPNNSMELIQALQRAGKSFELQVGPDMGHSAMNRDRMLEFFIENLVLSASAGTGVRTQQ